MRLGYVRGTLTLAPAIESFRGRRLILVEPITLDNLAVRNGLGGGKTLIAVDELGAHRGQLIAFTEGREAANPFWPASVPVDAYCAMIVDSIDLAAHLQDSQN